MNGHGRDGITGAGDPRQLFTPRLPVKALPRAAGLAVWDAMFPSRLPAFLSPNQCVVLVSLLPITAAWPAEKSPLSESFIAPTRVVWKSATAVEHAENLLKPKSGQAVLKEPTPPCVLKANGALLLDFGVEIQGCVELIAPMLPDKKPRQVRVRFGESANEAMAEHGEKGAQNDHAIRDETVTLP